MPFQIALSGLNAASTSLTTTANNIANVNTTGFKKSRANFVELFATGLQNVSATATGLGGRASSIQQQFSQGSLQFTDNNLDLALVGGGFFTLRDSQGDGGFSYTRAGNFGVNRDGFVVNDQGLRLQAFPVLQSNIGGVPVFNTGRVVDLQLDTIDASPQPSSNINLGLNLPSDPRLIPPTTAFDPEISETFSHTTSVEVFDSLGRSKTATYFFRAVSEANPAFPGDPDAPEFIPVPNTWDVFLLVDGVELPQSPRLEFSTNGALASINGVPFDPAAPTTGEFQFFDPNDPTSGVPSPGADNLNLTSSFANVTQFGSSFNVSLLQQDGFSSGRLISIEISPSGVVAARFTNGQSTPLGQLALTSFTNSEGLENVSDTRWAETFESGQALRGPAGSGNIGTVQAGALESANVDLAQELVNMITAQRTFQANAQMISTADSITQTIINIR